MLGLYIGIFLLIVCIIMFIFGGWDAVLAIVFVVALAIWLIYLGLKKIKTDNMTSKFGEKCYARVLECVKTGSYVLGREEYKAIMAVYVPSIKKTIFLEEIVGFDNYSNYPIDSYFSVLYYNNDINIQNNVNKDEVPSNILNILSNESIIQEYNEFKADKEQKEHEKQETMIAVLEDKATKVNRILAILTISGFYFFSISAILLTSYLSKMLEIGKDFLGNMPMSIIYPSVLAIHLCSITPMILSPENSEKRVLLGLLYFLTFAFIVFSTQFA